MKKISKILLGALPSLTIASSLPIVMSSCSCGGNGDVYFPTNIPKTQALDSNYISEENAFFNLAEKYFFEYKSELTAKYIVKMDSINMKWDTEKSI